MRETYSEMHRLLRLGQRFAVATVIASRGSTPRKPGAKMLIMPDGAMVGTIGGGCGEADVWQEAMEALKKDRPTCMIVDLTEDPEAEDRVCGGQMDVFIEVMGPPVVRSQ
ncbi:MAG: XdhC family protein [Chloroflexi bacterium]|nr:XdhC family protein [Chloroflexota bacterium]